MSAHKIFTARINAHVSQSGERIVRTAGLHDMGIAAAKVVEFIMRKAIEFYVVEKRAPNLNDLDKKFGILKSCGDGGIEFYNEEFFIEFLGSSLVVSAPMAD